jgi:hypothetical protein
VGTLDFDRGARLAREARDGLGIANCFRKQELDGHVFLEVDVARGHHDAHAARAEHARDSILAG